MRKYMTGMVIGAMLIAGQAAAQAEASDAAVVNLGDRLGAVGDTQGGNGLYGTGCRMENGGWKPDCFYLLAAGAGFIALVAYGFSQNGNGQPASP